MRRLVFIFLFLMPLLVTAQHPILSKFQGTPIPGGIYLEWTMIAGQTCNGTSILRDNGNGEFILIGAIDGICGSVDEPEDFFFLDNNPIEGVENVYKLRLGEFGATTALSVFYNDFEGAEFKMLLNQETNELSLIPSEASSLRTEVELYDMNGRMLNRFAAASNGTSTFSLFGIEEGTYIVAVRREDQLIFTDRFIRF